jgi:hypothetical protein
MNISEKEGNGPISVKTSPTLNPLFALVSKNSKPASSAYACASSNGTWRRFEEEEAAAGAGVGIMVAEESSAVSGGVESSSEEGAGVSGSEEGVGSEVKGEARSSWMGGEEEEVKVTLVAISRMLRSSETR